MTTSESDETRPEGEAEEAGKRMGFLEHLEELRRRVVFCALSVAVAFGVGWYFSDQILAFLLDPIEKAMGTLSVIRPAEAFMNKVKAAVIGALFLSLPMIFYQLWAFIAPGLYPKERRWVVPVITAGTTLFLCGAVFSYWVAVPAAANFLAEQGTRFESHVTVDSAFGFSTKLLLGLGAVFEMPLVTFALARLGIVTGRFLWKHLDKAIFFCFLAAAIITPTPDAMTMTIFAVPMVVLYLVSVLVAHLAGRPPKPESDTR